MVCCATKHEWVAPIDRVTALSQVLKRDDHALCQAIRFMEDAVGDLRFQLAGPSYLHVSWPGAAAGKIAKQTIDQNTRCLQAWGLQMTYMTVCNFGTNAEICSPLFPNDSMKQQDVFLHVQSMAPISAIRMAPANLANSTISLLLIRFPRVTFWHVLSAELLTSPGSAKHSDRDYCHFGSHEFTQMHC